MKNSTIAVTAAVLFAALFMAVSADLSDGDQPEYSIEGLVTDFGGTPDPALAGTRVDIKRGETTVDSALVDDDGRFRVKFVGSTTGLTAWISHPGYIASVDPTQSVLVSYGAAFAIDLSGLEPAGGVYYIDGSPVKMTESYFTAYLMESGSSVDTPLPDISITMTDAFGNKYRTVTDENGFFKTGIGSRYGLSLFAELDGYTPLPGINFMTVSGESVVFDLQGRVPGLDMSYQVPFSTSGGVITYSIPERFPILASPSTGIVVVNVENSAGMPIEGCIVNLTSTTDPALKYTQTTNKTGSATISTVKTGEYTVTTNVGGFEDSETGPVKVYKGGSTPLPTITLLEKQESSFLGMNMYHFLMVVGICLAALFMAVQALLHTKRLSRKLDRDL